MKKKFMRAEKAAVFCSHGTKKMVWGMVRKEVEVAEVMPTESYSKIFSTEVNNKQQQLTGHTVLLMSAQIPYSLALRRSRLRKESLRLSADSRTKLKMFPCETLQ